MKKILVVLLVTLILIGCEEDMRTEYDGVRTEYHENAVIEYHDEYIAITFKNDE